MLKLENWATVDQRDRASYKRIFFLTWITTFMFNVVFVFVIPRFGQLLFWVAYSQCEKGNNLLGNILGLHWVGYPPGIWNPGNDLVVGEFIGIIFDFMLMDLLVAILTVGIAFLLNGKCFQKNKADEAPNQSKAARKRGNRARIAPAKTKAQAWKPPQSGGRRALIDRSAKVIFVKMVTGRVMMLEAGPSDTIEHLKEQIRAEAAMPADHQCILFADDRQQQLEHGTLRDHGIKNRSTLRLLPSGITLKAARTVLRFARRHLEWIHRARQKNFDVAFGMVDTGAAKYDLKRSGHRTEWVNEPTYRLVSGLRPINSVGKICREKSMVSYSTLMQYIGRGSFNDKVYFDFSFVLGSRFHSLPFPPSTPISDTNTPHKTRARTRVRTHAYTHAYSDADIGVYFCGRWIF